MLTEDERRFMEYWETHRIRKSRVLRQLYVGLPLGVVLVIAIFVNFFSGWYTRAGMALKREDSSLILVLLAAALLIVVFIVIFSARHRWDMNEQHYRELLSKEKRD